MKLGIFYKQSNKQSVLGCKILKQLLDENNIGYVDIFDGEAQCSCSEIDLMVVFGGDGSVLKACQLVLDSVPLVAINTGTVGFLTSYEAVELKSLVEDILGDKLKFSLRQLIKIECKDKVYYALNDAVIIKNYLTDYHSGCVKLRLEIDKMFVDSYIADGLIFSTPTGSTAYALSAGGPIITPDLKALTVAPICAHSLHSRPIVYSQNSVALLTVQGDSNECAAFVDGEFKSVLCGGDTVKVSLADKCVKICDKSDNFFKKLAQKITMWSLKDGGQGE